MISRWMILTGIVLLSGCVQQARYHQETLSEIKQVRQDLSNWYQQQSVAGQQQQADIQQLTTRLDKLERQLSTIRTTNQDTARSLSALQTMVASRQEPASKRPTEIEQNGLSRNHDRLILGSREWVWIDSIAQHLKARVDSGATTSSLSAFNQVLFERNGKKWVRFKLEEGGDALSVEAPLLRWAYVQQASSDKPDKRAVVELWIQVGGVREKAEFTLSDRRKMTYPVLLGREFFKDIALIDVGKSYIQGKQRPMTETDASDSSDTHISPSDPAASEAPEDTKDRKS